MKTPVLLPRASPFRRLALAASALALALPAAAPAASKKKPAPAPAPAVADEPKEYTLFMGTDFAIQQGKEYYRVRDVSGGNFIIKVKEKEIAVPMRTGNGTLKVNQALKLTAVSARIDKLKAERAYTPDNDPYRRFNAKSGAAQGAADATIISGMNADAAARMATGAANAAAGEMRATGSVSAGTQSAMENAGIIQARTAQNFDEAAYQNSFSTFNNPGMAALELSNELAEENFDAMKYSFEISSEFPLNRPYLVFVVRYHEKDQPGKGGTSIYAKPIEPIGINPARINIIQTGMPVGFVVEECQVRLYDNGQEIATNVAPRRVAMNRDDAFDYMLIERLSRLKDATVDPAPAIGKLNEEAKSKLNIDQLKQYYYVKVSPEGRVEAAFRDEACSQAVDATVAAVLSTIRFYPALEKGRPVEGVLKFAFRDLTI
ncbi:MAG TPA: hypothetical protein VG734_05345 [Lacunisphaera sp.]|nr:hypothetical protein [Lacunisphaera sp.]